MRRLLFLLALLCIPLPSSARPGPLIIVLLPRTSLHDWRTGDAPCLHRLLATGALAVMNTRTARLPNDRRRETEESAALTLGAGSRAASVPEADVFLRPTTLLPGLTLTAREAYARRMATIPPPDASVNVAWPTLLKANTGRGYDIRIGDLADALAQAGIPIRAGGGPLSALVAVAGGGTVTPASSLRVSAGECLIWDAGSDLHAADGVLQDAASKTTDTGGTLMVLSPCASDTEYAQGRRLTPVLEWGAGTPAGLLTSPSTRRSGLVADTDFAPTVAAHFGVSKWDVLPFGRPWVASPVPQAVNRVSVLEKQSYQQAGGMRLLPYLALFLTAWIVVGTALARHGRLPAFWPLVPPALILAMLLSTGALPAAASAPACVLVAAVGLRLLGSGPTLLTFLTTIAAVLLADMTAGGWLMQRSLLGYSAVEGARYYGIGNEAMGPLTASLLVLTATLWCKRRFVRVSLVLILGLTALLLGSPHAGAKAGGLLVSMAAFGALLFSLSGRPWSLRAALTILLFVVLLLAAVAGLDAFRGSHTHSHLGEAVQRAMSGGAGEIADVIKRKLDVEGRLAYRSAWALPLWGGLACLLATWRLNLRVRKEEQALRVSGIVAVATCLLLNDAGVVAAALCIVVLWSAAAVGTAKKKPLEASLLPGASS